MYHWVVDYVNKKMTKQDNNNNSYNRSSNSNNSNILPSNNNRIKHCWHKEFWVWLPSLLDLMHATLTN